METKKGEYTPPRTQVIKLQSVASILNTSSGGGGNLPGNNNDNNDNDWPY